MIELEQYAVTDLSSGAFVRELNEIDPDKLYFTSFSCDEPKDDHCIFLEEKFTNFGCGNSVIFLEDNSFILNLITQLSDKNFDSLIQGQAWIPHRIFNLQLVSKKFGGQQYEGGAIIIQGHKLEMPDICDFGFIQFYCLPKHCRMDGNIYSTKELVTFYIYRNCKLRDKIVQPPLVNMVLLNDMETYVSMLPGQRMQLFGERDVNYDVSRLDSIELRPKEERTMMGDKKFSTAMVTCKEIPEKEEIVRFFHKGNYNTLRFIPVSVENDYFNVSISEPEYKCAVISNQYISAVRIKTRNPDAYIADDNYIDIEKKKREVILRFTNPLKNITLDRLQEIWWVDHQPQLPLDRLP